MKCLLLLLAAGLHLIPSLTIELITSAAVVSAFTTVSFQAVIPYEVVYSSTAFTQFNDQVCTSALALVPGATNCSLTNIYIQTPQTRSPDPTKPFASELMTVQMLLVDGSSTNSETYGPLLQQAINANQLTSPIVAYSASLFITDLELCNTTGRMSYRSIDCSSLPPLISSQPPPEKDDRVYVSNIGLALGILIAILALFVFLIIVFVSWYRNLHAQRQHNYTVLGEEMSVFFPCSLLFCCILTFKCL